MKNVILCFTRRHFGMLEGLFTHAIIRHVDRWHAAQWLKGIRRNTRLGRLEYAIVAVKVIEL